MSSHRLEGRFPGRPGGSLRTVGCWQVQENWQVAGPHGMSQVDGMAGRGVQIRPGVTFQVAHGSGQSPALVFLHGALGQRFNWRAQYEYALQQGWQALAYDLGGHGQSSGYSRYSVGRHGRDLHRLLDQVGIAEPILCGHSYGVPIALEYARRHPVQGLVLAAGGTHDLSPWWEPPLIRWMEAMGRHGLHSPWLQQVTQRLISAESWPRVEHFFLESPLPSAREPYRSMAAFWGYDVHRRPQLSNWRRAPALVISGGRDPMFTQAMGATLADQFLTGAHLHIEQAGHLLMAEEPEQINQAIDSWIRSRGGPFPTGP